MRECLALEDRAALLLPEHVLLAVARVPDPVHEQVSCSERGESPARPAVSFWVVRGEVDGAVAVGEGHTGEIPEDEHEAPFLVVHVPTQVSVEHSCFSWLGSE